jgi:DNA-binding XRE family transcriptional regulator
VALWQEGRSLAQIAAALRVSCRRARCVLREAGVAGLAVVHCANCDREIARGRPGLQGREAVLCLDCLAARPEAPFAQRLRAYRLAAGLTQDELAERASRSPTSIWQYEQGEAMPRAGTLARLVEVLGPGLAAPARRAKPGDRGRGQANGTRPVAPPIL